MRRIKELFRANNALIFERPMSRFKGYLTALVTAFLNWLVFYFVASKFNSMDPDFIAWILILSIVLHEIGHLMTMEWFGVKTHMFFAVIIGGAFPDFKFRQRFESLNWSSLAGIYLAGVTMNLVMALYGYYLYANDNITMLQFSQITNLNGALILYNLLPIWIFDGGRFAKALFDSIPEHKDYSFAITIFVAIAIVGIMCKILGLRDFIYTIPLILWGLWNKATNDDPDGSTKPEAMTRNQTIGWSVYYLLLVIAGMIMLAMTETWFI